MSHKVNPLSATPMTDQSLAPPDSMRSSSANHSSSSRSPFTSLQPDQSQSSSSSDSTPPGPSHSGNSSIMFSQGNLSLSSIQLLSRAQLSIASAPRIPPLSLAILSPKNAQALFNQMSHPRSWKVLVKSRFLMDRQSWK